MKHFALTLSMATMLCLTSQASVTYSEFKFGYCVPGEVHLEWTTTSETQNQVFRVQRSYDGVNWTIIGTVAGSGTTSDTNSYSFVDLSSYEGTNYYRLRQIDSTGGGSFSQQLMADFGPADCGFYIYPNPTKDKLLVNWEGCDIEFWNLKVTRLNGTIVYNQDLDRLSRVEVDLSGFNNGNYIVIAEAKNSKTFSQQIRKY